mmetsp:Transcript_40728/g.103679  ORF Transcript_40728/g.103679 Transcript_40728/m.103679 type:complete len:216 (+) Transcript_40728:324-971(+)
MATEVAMISGAAMGTTKVTMARPADAMFSKMLRIGAPEPPVATSNIIVAACLAMATPTQFKVARAANMRRVLVSSVVSCANTMTFAIAGLMPIMTMSMNSSITGTASPNTSSNASRTMKAMAGQDTNHENSGDIVKGKSSKHFEPMSITSSGMVAFSPVRAASDCAIKWLFSSWPQPEMPKPTPCPMADLPTTDPSVCFCSLPLMSIPPWRSLRW